MAEPRCHNCKSLTPRTTLMMYSGIQPVKPRAGDVSMCMKCSAWNVFTKRGGLREPNEKEYLMIAASSQAQQALRQWREMQEHVQGMIRDFMSE